MMREQGIAANATPRVARGRNRDKTRDALPCASLRDVNDATIHGGGSRQGTACDRDVCDGTAVRAVRMGGHGHNRISQRVECNIMKKRMMLRK